MKRFKLCSPLYKIALDEHFFVKPVLLDYIEKSKPSRTETISKLDYGDCSNLDREWIRFFRPIWKKNLQSFMQDVECDDMRLQDMWFQQYSEGDSHPWHIHRGNFTGVYYLELNKSPTTEIKDPFNKRKWMTKAKEGDMIIFPSHVLHRNPPNWGNRKTIVSWNFELL